MSANASTEIEADVAVLGAGPAGLSAALRLQQLGYRIALLERQPLPRPNPGEACTPGMANILQLLDAPPLPAASQGGLVLWEGAEPVERPAAPMVDRGAFDLALFKLLEQRGAYCRSAAGAVVIGGASGEWRLQAAGQATVHARVIVDARGPRTDPAQRIRCAAPLLGLWTDLAQGPSRSLVEAVSEGWLWGARRADGGYRLMAFCSPSALHAGADKPASWLRRQLAASRLFRPAAQAVEGLAVHVCVATPERHAQPWQDGLLKVGDAAFNVDPLSSSGTEKAMRCGLQAAVAIHTVLRAPSDEALAQRFYRDWVHEAALRHAQWACDFYARAWPDDAQPFWLERRRVMMADLPRAPAMAGQAVELPCVVDDRVQSRLAYQHPGLDRPVAFVAGHELVPLMRMLPQQASLQQATAIWHSRMPYAAAHQIAAWLQERGVLA